MANYFVSRISLLLHGVKIIPCRVASPIDIQLKQKDWGQSINLHVLLFTALDEEALSNGLLSEGANYFL